MNVRARANRWGTALAALVLFASALPVAAADPPKQEGASPDPKPVTQPADPKAATGASLAAAALTPLPGISVGGSPLERVGVTPDLNCYVDHVDDSHGEFYNDTACATLVVWNGVLYGPAAIPAGSNATPKTAFTPVSQSQEGSGSTSDPWHITTTVRLGATGVTVTQHDFYYNGSESVETRVLVTNGSGTAGSGIIYRAGDCYLQNDDYGFGRLDDSRDSVACVEAEDDGTGTLVKGRRVEEWLPLTPGSSAMHGWYYEVWSTIGLQQPFPNSARADEYIDNGAGLSWMISLDPGGSFVASHLTTFSPVLATSQKCDEEELIDLPTGNTSVTVRYDPRFIADESLPDFEQQAEAIATRIRDRAAATMAEYRDVLDFTVSDRMTISIECKLFFRGLIEAPNGTPAVTDAHDQIHIKSDYVYQRFQDQTANETYAEWAQTVDHELFHTIQGSSTPLGDLDAGLRYIIDGNRSIAESSAQLGQDLMEATDDRDVDGLHSSYLSLANQFIRDPVSVDTNEPNGNREYAAAGFIQYLGERYGPGNGTKEEVVSNFLRILNFQSPSRQAGYQTAIIKGGRSDDAWLDEVVRDYLITGYAHDAPNIRDAANRRWLMLDEWTPRRAQDPGNSQVQKYGDATPLPGVIGGGQVAVPLESIDGDIVEFPVPAGVTRVEVTVNSDGFFPTLVAGAVTVAADGRVTINGGNFARKDLFDPIHLLVDTTGAAKLAVIAVCGETDPCNVSVDTRDISVAPIAAGAASSLAGASVEAVTVNPGLSLGGVGRAGTPIEIRIGVMDGATPIIGATAIASVTDPGGTLRKFPLRDVGGGVDGGWHDGTYGARVFGTGLSGTYNVVVNVTGRDAAGSAFSTQASGSINLGSLLDQDGDTIANTTEPLVGTNPAVADAGSDVDRDGLTLAQELANGTNPFKADTDLSGEPDGSEVASGRDPRTGTDDVQAPAAVLQATPADGRRVEVSVASIDALTPVRVRRIVGTTVTDLGLKGGAGTTFLDGPITGGPVTYVAWTEGPAAVKSPPVVVGPVAVRDDATPPAALIQVNGGPAATNSSTVTVLFVDLTEPVTSMRIAGSQADLDAAPWVPFAVSSPFQLVGGDGPHEILAQVRDAAGNASAPAYSVAILDRVAPSSAAGDIPSFTSNPDPAITFAATDDRTGVDRTEVWTRYRPTSTGAWSAWAMIGASDASPITISLALGDGPYEVATVAVDRAGNREPLTTADGTITLDRQAPASTAGPVPATSAGLSLAVPFTASDALSGIATVELWSRFRATSTGTWSAWALGPSGSSSPLTFSFAQGSGFYEFYSIGIDRAGNREAPPAAADASTQRISTDATPPVSNAIGTPFTTTASSVSIAYNASDNASGVASVELWYRYRKNEAATWSIYKKTATGTSSPLTMALTDGDGNYEAYTIAIDGAGNREAAPSTADISFRRDALDDPPDFNYFVTATKPRQCQQICPTGGEITGASVIVTLGGGGTAVDDRSNVTVTWRLTGVKADGSTKKIFDFKAATPSDGSFNSRIEAFLTNDQRMDAGYKWYDVEIKVTAGLQSTSRVIRVEIRTVNGTPI